MKRIFEIEFPGSLGPLWMNTSTLLWCLTTNTHTSNVKITVRDVTGDGLVGDEPESAAGVKERT